MWVVAVIIGEYRVNQMFWLENIHQFNKIYSQDGKTQCPGYISESYRSCYYGMEIYHRPVGWRRHAINVGLNSEQFQNKYGQCPIAYHGTNYRNIIRERFSTF